MNKIKDLINELNSIDISKMSVEQAEQMAKLKLRAEEVETEEEEMTKKHAELQDKYKSAIFGGVSKEARDPVQKELSDEEIFKNAVDNVLNNK